MIYLKLFLEFFKTGLFAIGGGYATLPFLMEITKKYTWFTARDLTDMIAISESTPGPVGINMATFAGYRTAGPLGSVIATVALVLPSFLVILIIARLLQKFRDNRIVDGAFSGIRPAVSAMIAFAVWQIVKLVIFPGDGKHLKPDLPVICMILVITGLLQVPKLKKIHPVAWIGVGAILGILFRL